MIPLVGEAKELAYVKKIVEDTIQAVSKERGETIKYMVGTMIEIPRAAVTADEIAKEAQFFSFGTNDLTQMTFGFSRDDAGKFLAPTTTRRSSSPIRSPSWTRTALASWWIWLPSWAAPSARTSSWASAANTAAIRLP